jgi:NADH-ubiquinone oxidoreductase chain 1
MFPLLPVFIIFFIGSVAETNRAPFDLAEAESELVSGFMTEHAAVIFVFFFLAEYASIVLICILNVMLFIGGYLIDDTFIYNIFSYIYYNSYDENTLNSIINLSNYPLVEGLIYGLTIGIKSCVMIFIFI